MGLVAFIESDYLCSVTWMGWAFSFLFSCTSVFLSSYIGECSFGDLNQWIRFKQTVACLDAQAKRVVKLYPSSVTSSDPENFVLFTGPF